MSDRLPIDVRWLDDPPSEDVALYLEHTKRPTCEHGLNPCISCCGVRGVVVNVRWSVIPREERLQWFAAVFPDQAIDAAHQRAKRLAARLALDDAMGLDGTAEAVRGLLPAVRIVLSGQTVTDGIRQQLLGVVLHAEALLSLADAIHRSSLRGGPVER